MLPQSAWSHIFKKILIYLSLAAHLVFVAVCGLSPVAASGGSSLVAFGGLPIAVASPAAVVAWGPLGMWDLPRPGIEPMSPALAGRFLTIGSPRRPGTGFLNSTQSLLLIPVMSPAEDPLASYGVTCPRLSQSLWPRVTSKLFFFPPEL